MPDREQCEVEGCLCHTTTQPITEAVYGKKPRHRGKVEQYEAHTGTQPLWERVDRDVLGRLAFEFGPRLRKLAARRK